MYSNTITYIDSCNQDHIYNILLIIEKIFIIIYHRLIFIYFKIMMNNDTFILITLI